MKFSYKLQKFKLGMDLQTASVQATLAINITIGSISLILFECLRGQVEIFAPRLRMHNQLRNPSKKPWYKLLLEIVGASDDSVIFFSGMDSFVCLRFLLLCYYLGLVCSVGGCVILIPIYYTSPAKPDILGINKLAMGNVDEGDKRLWSSFIFTYVFTLTCLYMFHKEYENFAEKRVSYFNQGCSAIPAQTAFCVQVENIPAEYRSSAKLKEAISIVQQVLAEEKNMAEGHRARLGSISERAFNIEVFSHIDVHEFDTQVIIREKLLLTIFERLEAADISLAFPTQTIVFSPSQLEAVRDGAAANGDADKTDDAVATAPPAVWTDATPPPRT